MIPLLFLFGLIFSGCQHTLEIQEKSIGSDSFSPFENETKEGVPLGYVKTVKVSENGVEYTPQTVCFIGFAINFWKPSCSTMWFSSGLL